MARLKELYQKEIVDAMMKKFGYKNIMQVPKLDKIVINMGVGEAKDNPKQRNLLRTLKSEKAWQSDVRLPYAARRCMSLRIA